MIKRPILWATALLLTAALGTSTSGRVLAQEPPAIPFDCGPMRVLPGDLVAVNVGNAGRPPQAPLVVEIRLFDADGSPLLERSLTLAPGQSRSASVLLASRALVRGEVVPDSPPEGLRLKATMQVPLRTGGLTYGPIVECAGPTGNRGPV